MTRLLLVLRPEPGASTTVAAARALGLEATAAPLFVVRPSAWTPPDRLPDAILLTSANAPRHGGRQLEALTHLPVYAVGKATARAAREAGFANIVSGDAGVDAAIALAKRDGRASLLHLTGRDHREPTAASIPIERRIVYASDVVETLPPAASAVLPKAVVLLHSPRAARAFASFTDAPSGIAIAAISEAAREAAGPGWRAVAVAERPTEASLLAVAAKLCHHGG